MAFDRKVKGSLIIKERQEKREKHPTGTEKLKIVLGANDINDYNGFGRQNVSVEEIIYLFILFI